ncbi:hypothetical protein C2G38_2049142 [Gigaspora rosea]|uniref:Uncharacterized protein n=1 Tax=Gigaspora rosea TaxID=44941 RepID=A0A397U069_9GLOM|nr:hypothetical protein C2G38_2049142 [Gigaspora rosea]
MAMNTYAHAAVISASGDLNINPSLHFSYNCSSFNLGTPARQVDTCPFGYSPEGMMDYLANSQVTSDTGMSEYGGMVFSDQRPVPTIMEIMNGTVNAIANYSNVPLFDYSVNCTIESSQTFDQQVFIVQNGQPAIGIPNIYSAKGNNTKVSNQYSVAGWDSAQLVAFMVFPDGDGTGKVIFPTTTNVDNKLNRTVCSMKYIQQQGNVYIDFSNKNVSVTDTEIVKPNKGQLEIANYTLLEFTNLAVVASQLYRSPFYLYLGNDTDGNYSPKFLATQIKALLRKGHYLINTGFVNSGSGTIEQIEGTLYVNANRFNNTLLITIVLFIQTLLHLIGIIIVLLSFCTPVIAADIYAASTWWAFGAHASDKLVSGCTGIMSKEQRNMKLALRETSSGYLQMTIPTEGISPSESSKYKVNI